MEKTVRTSILVEVSPKVNDLVVVPHKRAKTFSKLIASLLQGYIEDDYIRSYGDGTISNMARASVDVLDDILGSMTESLSNMGVYSGGLKSANERGMQSFSEYAEKKKEDIQATEAMNEEVENLKEEFADLKEQNNQILALLTKLSTTGVSTEGAGFVDSETTGKGRVEKDFVEDSFVEDNFVKEGKVPEEPKKVIQMPGVETVDITPKHVEKQAFSLDDDDDDDEDSVNLDASSLMDDLLTGNLYSV